MTLVQRVKAIRTLDKLLRPDEDRPKVRGLGFLIALPAGLSFWLLVIGLLRSCSGG